MFNSYLNEGKSICSTAIICIPVKPRDHFLLFPEHTTLPYSPSGPRDHMIFPE